MPLELTRGQVLAHRRRVGPLDERLPPGKTSLRRAAWAGLQDSMPRAAVLSIHARIAGAAADAWENPAFVQVWGPRFSAYVVPARDRAVFTLGRLPDDPGDRRFADDLANRLEAFLDGRTMTYGEAGRGLGEHPNRLRYAAPTGRVLIRWEGARQPTIWTIPPPDMDPGAARLELARRYLHVFGPTTASAFRDWAGIRPRAAAAAFESLQSSLTAVRSPTGDGWILTADESSFRAPAQPLDGAARLLPSGDAFTLLQGADRGLLVPDPKRQQMLWTPRVWPGAVLLDGEIVGTWRRGGSAMTVHAWSPLPGRSREAVEAEARSFPLPATESGMRIRWED